MVVMMICFCGMVDQRKLLSLFSSRDYYQRFLPSQPPVHFELDWSCTEPESRLRWVQLWISDNHYTDTYKTFRFLVQRFFKFFSWMRQKWQKVYWSYYIKPYQTTGDTSSNPISFPRWMVRIICNMRINLSWCSRYHQGFYSYWLSRFLIDESSVQWKYWSPFSEKNAQYVQNEVNGAFLTPTFKLFSSAYEIFLILYLGMDIKIVSKWLLCIFKENVLC